MYDAANQYILLFVVVALFLVPAITIAVRRKLLRQFSFSSLVKVFNRTLVIQVVVEVILLAGSTYISDYNIRE